MGPLISGKSRLVKCFYLARHHPLEVVLDVWKLNRVCTHLPQLCVLKQAINSKPPAKNEPSKKKSIVSRCEPRSKFPKTNLVGRALKEIFAHATIDVIFLLCCFSNLCQQVVSFIIIIKHHHHAPGGARSHGHSSTRGFSAADGGRHRILLPKNTYISS